jgi:hypothetical protein
MTSLSQLVRDVAEPLTSSPRDHDALLNEDETEIEARADLIAGIRLVGERKLRVLPQ